MTKIAFGMSLDSINNNDDNFSANIDQILTAAADLFIYPLAKVS
jgi:hypothetical protein